MIITPTSLTITQLLGSSNEQYVVPAYQRRYSWHKQQIWELIEDIKLIDGTDTHLLGSIVCLTGQHVAGLNRLELVDGQQRLTTISILLHCINDRLLDDGEVSDAQEISRLLTAKALGYDPLPKICLDSIDAAEFQRFVARESIGKPENVNLRNAFALLRGWVHEQSLSDLGVFLYRLMNQAIVIRLDVSEAKDAFKLFETINNRGLRLSPTDIIKNFLLGNAARFGNDALSLARLKWADLVRALDGVNSETFFRQYLASKLRRRITVSFVIRNFKKIFMERVNEASALPDRHWYVDEDLPEDVDEALEDEADERSEPIEMELEPLETEYRVSFSDFLTDLVACAEAYGQIVRGETGVAQIDHHLRNLKLIKSVQTYGFFMYLRVGGCSDRNLAEILRLTEAFMLRRHTCRQRSNENESAYARLCGVDCKNPLPEVIEVYREFSPSDERFREEFANYSFASNVIDRARYILEQFEMRHHGTHAELHVNGPEAVHVEHIMPQKIKSRRARDEFGDWPRYLGRRSELLHPKFVGRIGNLTLFAGSLNIGASNNPYERKKEAYRKSGIVLTQSLAEDYPEFGFDQIRERSEHLADLAVQMWPAP